MAKRADSSSSFIFNPTAARANLIKLFYGSAKEAHRNNRAKITTSDLSATFEEYSNERLQDIINEFKSELPAIGALVHGMRPTKKEKTAMQNYSIQTIVYSRNCASSVPLITFNSPIRLRQHPNRWQNFYTKLILLQQERTMRVVLCEFILIRTVTSKVNSPIMDFIGKYIPAYRWALQPGDMDSIFKMLELGTD